MLTRQGFLRGLVAYVASFFGRKGKRSTTEVCIDATTHQSYQRTFCEATEGMNDDQRGDVIAAIAAIWVTRGEKFPVTSVENDRAIERAVHGMTVTEILKEGR